MGKIEQALAAIQEAETLDEGNPDVWVQVSTLLLSVIHILISYHTLAWPLFCSNE